MDIQKIVRKWFGITELKGLTMAQGQGLTDLQTAVTNLTTSVSAAVALIASLNAQIATLQGQTGDSDADVETAAQAINNQITALNTAVGTN